MANSQSGEEGFKERMKKPKVPEKHAFVPASIQKEDGRERKKRLCFSELELTEAENHQGLLASL